jgi:hypothetical protein
MKKLVLVFVFVFVGACGAPATRRHEGPDVVAADWTSGDDAVLDSSSH